MGRYDVHRICTMAQRFNSPSDAVDFGKRLRLARKKAGLTLQKLQEDLGVDHSQISRIERGRAVTMSENVHKLSTRLRVSLPVGGWGGRTQDLARRVQALVRNTPAAAEALTAVVNALESLTDSRR